MNFNEIYKYQTQQEVEDAKKTSNISYSTEKIQSENHIKNIQNIEDNSLHSFNQEDNSNISNQQEQQSSFDQANNQQNFSNEEDVDQINQNQQTENQFQQNESSDQNYDDIFSSDYRQNEQQQDDSFFNQIQAILSVDYQQFYQNQQLQINLNYPKKNTCKKCDIAYKNLSGLHNHVKDVHRSQKVQDFALEPAQKRGRPKKVINKNYQKIKQ
ncbi:zinc finger, C2H2 type family protein (macronuclear) [Tetrahymena thermophila SB210]|uniref:Zinc finger, C2H2 type family protein n=1 Tax=Tetrahymena thermophila (strain SB210) TaxID=312017 RepID=I7LUU9_TETTS|nr:zinc finger, C2H2 type family protein [Tetrahymena thermophila SB210]EAR96090.2 zinc finger, C2H2 type family protein [Tetrahymena thermophila SB210]|eukprot:XP_001016335.2 zinc finger, C2H2 type family protein [Tetrahymena thermophila SB210]